MKWAFFTIVVVLLAFCLWLAPPDSRLNAVRGQITDKFDSARKSVAWSFKGEQEKQELLACKREELKAHETALQQVEVDITKMSDVGTCRRTGEPNQFILNQDPRPELQAKIDRVKEEIRKLESKS
jgi:hypothetical protein